MGITPEQLYGRIGQLGPLPLVGRVGAVKCLGRVSRVARVGRVSRVGRVGRVSRLARVSRVARVGRVSRVGRVGRVSRVGRIGRVGPSMNPTAVVARIGAEHIGYHYDPGLAPALSVDPGTTVEFETLDARAGALYDRPVGTLFELPKPNAGKSNPITGPLAIRGARPGDALAIHVERIDVTNPGWGGGHAYVNPLWPGRVPRALARIVDVVDGQVRFSEHITIPAAPMLGCVGVAATIADGLATPPDGSAPSDPIHAGWAGRHGGNLDQKVLTAGTTLYLPVVVPDALLYVGDAHAAQGDGELSGTAIEIGSLTRVRVDLVRKPGIGWPWLETRDRWMVFTAHTDFTIARRDAVDAVVTLLERDLRVEPAEALALLAGAGDLRIGQSMGGAIPMTLRLEIPKWEGVNPVRAGS